MRLQKCRPLETLVHLYGPLKQEVYEEEHKGGCGQVFKYLTRHSEIHLKTVNTATCLQTHRNKEGLSLLYSSAITRPLQTV